jgi:hypothetical protein
MIIKTLKTGVDALVVVSVWCAAVMVVAFVAILILHVLMIGGLTAYCLMHS